MFIILTEQEWQSLSDSFLPKLIPFIEQEFDVNIVEEEGKTCVAIPVEPMKATLKKAIRGGVKTETQEERQFVAMVSSA